MGRRGWEGSGWREELGRWQGEGGEKEDGGRGKKYECKGEKKYRIVVILSRKISTRFWITFRL